MDAQQEIDAPIKLSLNGISLLYDGTKWKSHLSDMDKAALEIHKVMDERDNLLHYVEESKAHVATLKKEIVEVNETKRVALELLMNERHKNIILEEERDAYKAEFEDSVKTIATLKRQLAAATGGLP